MLQQYDFSGSRLVNTKGTFFRYQSGNAAGLDNAIILRVDNVPVGKYYPGDLVRLPDPHNVWSIEPVTPTCIGTVVIGFGSVESASMQGVVQVVNGERARTLAGLSFMGKMYTGDALAPSAGNYTSGVIWNPAGSGKNVWVTSIQMFASATPAGSTNNYAYMGVTQESSLPANHVICPTQPKAKRVGSPDPSCRFYVNTVSIPVNGLPWASRGDVIVEGSSVIQQAFPIALQEPILLQPGKGLRVFGGSVGIDTQVQFTEDPA